MKTTAFKVFASCAAIVCFASSAASRATTENPIEGVEPHKNLVGQEDFVMDLKRYISWSIANEMEPATAVHGESHRQRRSYDHELDTRLRKELEGDDSPDTIEPTSRDAVQIDPDGKTFQEPAQISGEGTLDSEQSNDIQEPQLSNSGQDSLQSNDIEEPQLSNSGQDSLQSNDIEEPQLSNSGQDSQPSNDFEAPGDSDDMTSYGESEEEPYDLNESDHDDVSGGNSYPDASRKGY